MDDLINRQAAINKICSKCAVDKPETYITIQEGNNWCEEVYTLLNMPSEPQWIPCSVRLPKEKDGRVLITLDGEVTTAIYSEFSKTWYIGDMCGVSDRIPTAWMPRPKPYRSK